MSAQIIDGNAIASRLRSELKLAVAARTEQGLPPPGLAVILVGNDPASEIYVRHKRSDCEEVGFHSEVAHLSALTTQEELERIQNLFRAQLLQVAPAMKLEF